MYIYIYSHKTNAIMIMVVEDPMTTAKFAIMSKNTTNGFCDEFVCTIVLVVVNVLYDYECSHICSHIIHILTQWEEGPLWSGRRWVRGNDGTRENVFPRVDNDGGECELGKR
jgi:hypothetical protein